MMHRSDVILRQALSSMVLLEVHLLYTRMSMLYQIPDLRFPTRNMNAKGSTNTSRIPWHSERSKKHRPRGLQDSLLKTTNISASFLSIYMLKVWLVSSLLDANTMISFSVRQHFDFLLSIQRKRSKALFVIAGRF